MSIPKVLLMLLVWLLYTVVVYKGCLEECCSPAADEITTVIDTVDTAVATRYPIDFQWDKVTAATNDGFAALKQSTLSEMTDSNILEIIGLYHDGEAKPADYDNIGFARADAVRKLFAGDIPDEKTRLRARLIDEKAGVRENYFTAHVFNWIEPEKQAAQTLEELDDRIIIRFPTNSTSKHTDVAVDEYLEKLANRVKTSEETIQITGHADNIGNEEGNLRLSKKRAEKVRDILISKGVDKALINIDFKGFSQPVASNDTEEGRQENRRAEVRLIKK